MTDSATVAEGRSGNSAGPLALEPLNSLSLRDQAYARIKEAIANTDVYSERQPLRLDERELMRALAVSRTPVREALSLLEQHGFVKTVPRRGIFIVRKSKREIVEIIQVWAALEGMSARLATLHAPDAEIGKLRRLFDRLRNSPPGQQSDEYANANIALHRAIIGLGGSRLIADATENLFIHVRAVRKVIFAPDARVERWVDGHLRIIEALEGRDTELAERLTRQHTLELAAQVERYSEFPE